MNKYILSEKLDVFVIKDGLFNIRLKQSCSLKCWLN